MFGCCLSSVSQQQKHLYKYIIWVRSDHNVLCICGCSLTRKQLICSCVILKLYACTYCVCLVTVFVPQMQSVWGGSCTMCVCVCVCVCVLGNVHEAKAMGLSTPSLPYRGRGSRLDSVNRGVAQFLAKSHPLT